MQWLSIFYHHPLSSLGVVNLFGPVGGLGEFKASFLASHRFVALALASIDYEYLPLSPSSINLPSGL